jgi:SAM-dependent methyltransferase
MAYPYAERPSSPPEREDCYFYHCMDIPGHGTVPGEWDLRGRVDEYLGGVELSGRRVLEVGTASGFLCFEMEERGAEVVACDLSPEQSWDIVPFAGKDLAADISAFKAHLGHLNNGYWLAHHAFGSRANVVYSDVYSIPEAVGPVDVTTFGCVLLHVRDPFLALSRALSLTQDTAVVVEVNAPANASTHAEPHTRKPRGLWPRSHHEQTEPARQEDDNQPLVDFLPDPANPKFEAWWQLSPAAISRMLGVLGFETERVARHTQLSIGGPVELFTVVAHRAQRAMPL